MILITGLAGSGKSTQGELLQQKLDCPWLGMGNLLRASADEELRQHLLTGELVDDSIALRVMGEELAKMGAADKQFILDGFPRSLEQARWLGQKVAAGELKDPIVIHIKTHEEIAEQRLMQRGRVDDHRQAIMERFNEYEKSIKPILDYFKAQGFPVIDIDGEQTIEQVHQEIIKAINK